MIRSYELDCFEPNGTKGIKDLKETLGYYGRPSQDASSYESFVDEIIELLRPAGAGSGPENSELLHHVIDGRPLRVYTQHDYPLGRIVFTKFDINPDELKELTLGHLLYLYTLAYQEIYSREAAIKNQETSSNDPFGHCIDDLAYNGDSTIRTFIDADGVSAVFCYFECDS
jgi:hypothetical protein